MPLVTLPAGVRMTPALLKQIMDQCGTCNPCGSGSGSGGSGSGSGSGGSGSGSGGGGGLNSCCGCDVFPDTLTISITIGCIPKTRTLTLSKSLAQSECTTPPSSAINVEYLGSTAPVVTEGSFSDTNCVSGAGVISDSAVDDQYVVGLYCVRCNSTPPYVYKWFITITASNIAATTHQSLVEYYNEISAPATCSPLTFATVSKTIVCENNKTSNGVCNSQNLYNEPYVGYSYCVGSSFSFDISE